MLVLLQGWWHGVLEPQPPIVGTPGMPQGAGCWLYEDVTDVAGGCSSLAIPGAERHREATRDHYIHFLGVKEECPHV